MTEEQIYTIALQRITFNHPQAALELYQRAGGAKAVHDCRHDIMQLLPDATPALSQLLRNDWQETLRWAEKELTWCEEKKIRVLTPGMADYPQRLVECADAPLVVYYRGTSDLNSRHIISMVGTRQSTEYGHDVIHRMMQDLRKQISDVLIISGLAYGIDVESHREALAVGYDTVGVLAHGLDTIYPAVHRNTAVKMVEQGGLLTEYTSQAHIDRQNFLRRNRIVAGLSDATIVVESKARGGSLATARLATEYGREVMAVPGRIDCDTSAGCNELIRSQRARILTCAQDIIDLLGWHADSERTAASQQGIQRELFSNFSPEEQKVVDALSHADLHINELGMQTGLSISSLSAILFGFEMRGVVRAMAGNKYHLIR